MPRPWSKTGKVAASKMHWCPACRTFRAGKVREIGYYKWKRVLCAACDRDLGSPL